MLQTVATEAYAIAFATRFTKADAIAFTNVATKAYVIASFTASMKAYGIATERHEDNVFPPCLQMLHALALFTATPKAF